MQVIRIDNEDALVSPKFPTSTVDVAAAYDSNKYPQNEVKWQYNQWMAERTEGDEGYKTYESYGYNWLGKMSNNIHVTTADVAHK